MAKAFMALIVTFFSLIFSAMITIWSNISGWGLTPKSWAVIIWAIIIQWVLMVILQIVSKLIEKDRVE